MPLLSKAEVQFLNGQKHVSKSYGYKLKSIIKKKLATFLDFELIFLSALLQQMILTKNSQNEGLIGQSSTILFSRVWY